ncbi:Bystin-domain-containing protein [Eremomyces bilateralis CBS 781.70]|uniref:Bystin-domain-containing protein n=1 Tax=Eremomyces bilateralis CBS 781.70 TaxID=1392243 RepID=A0A6G1GB68_9PEZI|nr:Bystin-domain-containing protein [Eremomyces bilateralis CBS 781.70]KAF1815283.1 Bystin-domain-containing protein [Eremomyces bilateralis CBS 781.70]
MPKTAQISSDSRQQRRHNPLADEYDPVQPFKNKVAKRRKSRHDGDEEERFVDTAASRKILRIGQDLEEEEAAEQRGRYVQEENVAFQFESRFPAAEPEEDEGAYDDEDAWGDEDEVVEEVEVDPNDLDLFNKFNPSTDPELHWPGDQPTLSESKGGTNLADLILSKIAAHEALQSGNADEEDEAPSEEIPPKVLQVYTTIGPLLSRMTTGKPPKPFTIIPTLPLPTQATLLSLTEPLNWTPHAAYTATKLFISGTPASAQMFLTEALLPLVRERIDDHAQHKLHQTLYRALKKALYKPSAFFKGLLFPLLESMPSMREAHIIASVIARVSIPVLHSAAALLRLTEIAADSTLGSWNTKGGDAGGAGPVNWCIKILIEKRYALPYRVIDALVFHFLRYRGVGSGDDINMSDTRSIAGVSRKNLSREESLPLLWHQSLLAFAQRYRDDITEDQREALLDLLLAKGHRGIGPEVRRELLAGRGRGNAVEGAAAAVENGGDDTMEGVQIGA